MSDRERRRLDAVIETGLLDGSSSPALERAVHLVRTALGTPLAFVNLIDANRQFAAAASGLDRFRIFVREAPLSHAYCLHVVRDEAKLVVDDSSQDERFREHPAYVDLNVVAYVGVPIRTRDGHVLGSLCAIDVRPRSWTERDLAILEDTVQWVGEEMDLRRKLAQAQRSSQHLAQLHDSLRRAQELATSSTQATLHDLRSPLTALGIGLDQLAFIVRDQPVTRLVDTLHRNLDYIGSIVDAASDEMGVGPVQVVDAARITADVRDHVSVPEGVELLLSVPAQPVPVRFGRALLRRCIVNLTDNALRFARHQVHVTQHRENEEVVTRVDDDGPGLPHLADYARIGEPNLRLHAHEGFSGSGLGLSIAHRLLGDHGGALRGEPSPLGGARLEMRLPVAQLAGEP